MHKAHKVRIYPTWIQRFILKHHFGCNRFIYNKFIDINQEHYDKGNKLSYFDMCDIVTGLKKKKKFNFLNKAYSQSLQISLKNLCAAFRNLAEGRSKYPRRKNKYGPQSAAYPQGCKIKGNRIKIPKIGWIESRDDREAEGKIKTVTIKKTVTDEYYASILFETKEKYPKLKSKIKEHKVLGIDLGISLFAVTSDGQVFINPRWFEQNFFNLKCKQKKLSRKQRGSNNRNKARKQVAKVHRRIVNARKDFHHKLSSYLVAHYNAIIVEDLNVEGMVKNHSLARHIQQAGWKEFLTMLEYKCKWNGKHFIKVDRFYPSSKTCNECGTVNKMLSQGDREWQCSHCNTIHDRDFNAALNLQKMGINKLKTEGCSVSACGGHVIPSPERADRRIGPVKQEVPASVH